MTESPEQLWRQMRFVSPEGRVEVLWVEPVAEPDTGATPGYRILSVPVWLYDVSVGTLVEGREGAGGRLEFVRVLEAARGGTVRLVTPPGHSLASRLYLDRVLADCQARNLGIGPATFFDPRLVAIHVHDWETDHEVLLSYLAELTAAGQVQEWELGDPAVPSDEPPQPARPGAGLVHPRPGPRQPYHRAPEAAT